MKEKVRSLLSYLRIYKSDAIIVSDGAGWVIDNVSYNINENLCAKGIRSTVIGNISLKNLIFLRQKTLYFVNRWAYLTIGRKNIFKKLSRYNRIIVMWWHSGSTSNNIELFNALKILRDLLPYISVIHVPCCQEQKLLIAEGILEEKIKVIPEGIENFFKAAGEQEKKLNRKSLRISLDSFCIGFFQKDGVGWGEGNEPKLEKGPDIFIEVIKKLFEKYKNIFIVLTGPSRGYIKHKLEEIGVPFRHDYLSNYKDIVNYYSVLDLYLITSRTEGGPKSVLEAMACGIPVVSTRVGMCIDIIEEGSNGFLCDIESVEQLSNKVEMLILDKELRRRIVVKALDAVRDYSWDKITDVIIDKCFNTDSAVCSI